MLIERMGRGARLAVAAALIAVMLAAAGGCTTLYSSENPRTGVSFMLGKLEATLGAEPPQVAAATAKAFKDLRMRERYARSSGLDAEFVGRTATSKQVTVTVKRCAPGQSVIFIQVGYFGDALLSTGLLEQIRANLTAAGVGRMGLPMMPVPQPDIRPQ